ncbi:MAG: ABC transporter permease [Bacteroidetes bacterium]|nr:ABC transporter permease [Bacteroidota bacterium]
MLKSYFLSLYRNFIKNKFYSFLNVVGLSVGIATAIFILLYIQDELGYDRYHKNHERIFRLESEFTVSNNQNTYATVPAPLGPALKREIPEIEEMCRLAPIGSMAYHYKDIQFIENHFYLADSSVFKVFSHVFLRGNPTTCLVNPFSIVLTEKIATRYFGMDDPIGKVLTDRNGNQLKVTAVIEDLPGNSHLRFDALISMSSDPDTYNTTKPSRFWRLGAFTFVLLHPKASIETVHEKFLDFYHSQMESLGKQYGVSFRLMTTPLTKTHFRKGLAADLPIGNMAYIYIFSAIALFVLMLAAINYMNMATARSATRAKEVGMRKVMGADKANLRRQFMGESIVIALLALVIALIIVWIFLSDFNAFTGKMITFNPFDNGLIFLEIFGVALLVGLISGSYPAFYLSAFQPIRVLKGNTGHSGKNRGLFRKVLVVIQFFIAILMIISSFVVTGQLNYMKKSNLGFKVEDMIVIEVQDKSETNNLQTFKDRLLQSPGVNAVTNSSSIAGIIADVYNLKMEQESGMSDRVTGVIRADFDFIKTYKMEIVAGRDFDRSMGTDLNEAVIINQTAAEEFDWARDPIGKKIEYGFKQDRSDVKVMKVIGVVRDFYFKSLHNEVEPIIIILSDQPEDFLTCRLSEADQVGTLDYIELQWQFFYNQYPFNYRYLADRMDDMYKTEEKISSLVSIATFITIFIALLGLLGLSSFIAEQKTKEIGLRKIMGASVINILTLLYREFLILMLIAFVLAVPIAWWQLQHWLETTFIYHPPIQWTNFLFAGLVTFIVGFSTISFYIVRAASRNPVETIKYE